MKPVDPNDPGKGYVPPTPDETGKDTPIPYVQNGNVVVNYVTEDGTVIKSPVNDETDAPAGKSYDTTDNKPKLSRQKMVQLMSLFVLTVQKMVKLKVVRLLK